MLARFVELLQANDRNGMATAMIYLSDHGESLGEANVYLHGMPYRLAPEAQKHIPLLLWLSVPRRSAAAATRGCWSSPYLPRFGGVVRKLKIAPRSSIPLRHGEIVLINSLQQPAFGLQKEILSNSVFEWGHQTAGQILLHCACTFLCGNC